MKTNQQHTERQSLMPSQANHNAQAARDASKKYNLDVKANTVRKCILKGESTVQKTGPKGKISEEEYNAIKTAFLSYLAISQMNGEAEKKKLIMTYCLF
jgi:hypothetical protein